jgi:diguanylate cyclase (GGDEF)-like protein/PAS domain S-box-containing protein
MSQTRPTLRFLLLTPFRQARNRLRAAWRAAAAAWSSHDEERDLTHDSQPRVPGPVEDMTARWSQRQAQVLRAITEAIPATVVVVDTDGRYRFANSAFGRLVGRRPEQILGHTAVEVLGAEEVERRRPFMRKAYAGEAVDFTLDYPDGQGARHLALSCIPLHIDGVLEGFVGISRDVTRQRREQDRLRALFELSPVGIGLSDLESGRFIEVNDALVAPSGYTREEFLNRNLWDLTPAAGIAPMRERHRQLLQSGRFGPIEREYLRKDGSTFPVLVSGATLKDPDGRMVVWSISQDISRHKALELKLAEAARLDKLTGLANRAVLMERLQSTVERVQRDEQPCFAVLFLDFDRFKLVNDSLGHDAGDDLLRQIAQRLQDSLGASDAMNQAASGNVVARFGGDEFVVLINDIERPGDAVRIADRLLLQLEPGYLVKGRNIHSTASIGIVCGDHCLEGADAIVRNADVAMYEAKRAGRARSVVFSDTMHQRLARQLTIEHDLRKALASGGLWLAYQPIVDLENRQTVSVEALVRWTHPALGEMLPGEFIAVAEESGLIVQVGAWVLEEACRQMSQWRRAQVSPALRTISVNLSRAELALGEQLFDRVMSTLRRHELPPDSLQLEITEYEVMRDPLAARALMRRLRAAGVRLAIDDFGTGTSSLACLRDYPFDTVKIAREFLQDMSAGADAFAVLHAATTLVTNLGKASVAEGVDDPAQIPMLLSLGCQYVQGYLLGKPVRAEELFQAEITA